MTGVCTAHCTGCVYIKTFSCGMEYCDYFLMTGKRRPCPGGDGCTERVARRPPIRKSRTAEERAAFAEKQKQRKREQDRDRYQRMTPEQRERKRQACREYYARNKAEMDARHAEWYKKNREKVNAYQRELRRQKRGG